jgi:O-antigen/teichoic acid export membrane protein
MPDIPVSINKRIVKNTLFLYFRMMFIMFVSLYTSRVVLRILGVDDFGLYQVVGGVVGLISFISGSLSVGTSRFLTYELGTGDYERLNRIFCTTLNSHIILSFFIILLAETVGLWFVYNKLNIPVDRLHASVLVYHLSVITIFFTITQVPFTACIIAYEKMDIYAYISIFEALARLGVVYLLRFGEIDRLVLYAALLCFIQIIIALFYRFFCTITIKATKYHFIWDKNIFKPIISFSGWSMFAQVSIALNTQGASIITNIFFGPAVVAARAIALQVNMAANQFVNNFRTAINPQIIKKYASGDREGSRHLLLESTKYSYYLMFILGLPIIFAADTILLLWLGTIPEYTVIFLQLAIIQSLFSVFDTSFYAALYTKGRLRENALISPVIGFISFPIVYLFFKLGYSPVVLSYASIIGYILLGTIIKPMLIIHVANYPIKDVISVFISCIKVTCIALIVPLVVKYLLDDSIFSICLICIVSIISVAISVYFMGLDKNLRLRIRLFIKGKIIK